MAILRDQVLLVIAVVAVNFRLLLYRCGVFSVDAMSLIKLST